MSTVDNKTISQDVILELEKLAASFDIGLEMTANIPIKEVNDALLLMGLNPKDPLPSNIKELVSKKAYLSSNTEQPGEAGEALSLKSFEEESVEKDLGAGRKGGESSPSQELQYREQDPNAVLVEKDIRFKETWQPRLTLIVSLLALTVTVFAVFIKDYQGIGSFVASISARKIHLFIIISNLIVSLIALIFLVKQRAVDYLIKDKEKFRSLAELDKTADMEIYTTNLNNRVGKLVNQFRLQMTLFAFSLVLIYGVILLGTLAPGSETNTGSSASGSVTEKAAPAQAAPAGEGASPEAAAATAVVQPGVESPKVDSKQEPSRKIGYFPISTNLINLLGALFVQLGFSVLFNKTLEPHQAPVGESRDHADAGNDERYLETRQILTYNSSLYWSIPLMMFVLYALVFVSLSISYLVVKDDGAITRFLNIFDLLAGSANGLTMSLLFGRYVSIEQSIRNTKQFKIVFKNIFYPFSAIPYRALVSLSIIFILPIYALAQPLFGSLRIEAFGTSDNFQTVVYAICLVGKICFFHLTYILVSKKLLHLYLYGLVAEVGNYKELEACFEKPSHR